MIAVIDYRAGNAPSVLNALERIGVPAMPATAPEDIRKASAVILPGVGSAGATMKSLSELNLLDAIYEHSIERKRPFLGVCVGLQVLFEHSEEENATCLGYVSGRVRRFSGEGLRVPQMGWNRVAFTRESPLLRGIKEDYFYFVNSYYVEPEDKDVALGLTDYGGEFCSVLSRDNLFGTQFHIEKSGEAGLSLLRNFAKIAGGDVSICSQNG